jgi:hypothetical protein
MSFYKIVHGKNGQMTRMSTPCWCETTTWISRDGSLVGTYEIHSLEEITKEQYALEYMKGAQIVEGYANYKRSLGPSAGEHGDPV